MLFLGGDFENAFDQPFNEALPLADKPHLLKPKATKEELFGRARGADPKGSSSQATSVLPDHMSLVDRMEQNSSEWQGGLTPESCPTISQRDSLFAGLTGTKVEPDALLSRWRKTVELFARVFMDDVGSEEESVLRQLASFSLRQSKFQKEMDDLRHNSSGKTELSLNVHRTRDKLIPQTVKKLNEEYQKIKESASRSRKMPEMKTGLSRLSERPHRGDNYLVAKKIKVKFEGEPGEGNGVMRSFFTTIADAFLENKKVPAAALKSENSSSSSHGKIQFDSVRLGGIRGSMKRTQNIEKSNTLGVSVNAEPWEPMAEGAKGDPKFNIKERIYRFCVKEQPQHAAKLTGMLAQLSTNALVMSINDDEMMKYRINEAVKLLKDSNKWDQKEKEHAPTEPDECPDDAPLFFLPNATQRYYSLEPGRATPERLNIFRNTGRILGLSLLHNELCPLPLSRPVVKQVETEINKK